MTLTNNFIYFYSHYVQTTLENIKNITSLILNASQSEVMLLSIAHLIFNFTDHTTLHTEPMYIRTYERSYVWETLI